MSVRFTTFLAAAALVAGCYNPNLPSGTLQCSPTGACPEGFQCGSDARCHKMGQVPPPPIDLSRIQDLSATPPDLAEGVPPDLAEPPDLVGADLAMKCTPQSCMAPTPVCDPDSGRCVPCLPTNDLCPMGQSCSKVMDEYKCLDGCKVDKDCPMLTPDGGNPVQLTCCNQKCVDKSSDKDHCGKCGNQCGVATCCTGTCVDTNADVSNCGACGKTCSGGRANWSCAAAPDGGIGSACTVQSCQGTNADCNKSPGDGCEVNLTNDVKNCGACGNACNATNAQVACANGCFISSCNMGFGNCNNDLKDGCEVDLQSDVKNCGVCGKACPAPPNGTAACKMGVCGVGACNNNFQDCNNSAADGCETNVTSDAKNCSKCGNACPVPPNGAAVCANGTCGVGQCGDPKYKDCDGNGGNGCETDTSRNVNHCGACNMRCATPPNGAPDCIGSLCKIGVCNAPFRDCDGNVVNGCEVNTASDPANCNGCGNRCNVANGVGACQNGSCAIASCNAPYQNCANGIVDGCETNTGNDAKNCGACGKVCALANATPVCTNGACLISQCTGNFRNCNNNAADGCEIDITVSAGNCGACGRACGGGQSCVNGGCTAVPLPQPSYNAVITFTDGLPATTMTIAWDGGSYWSSSGGGPQGVRLARYDANGRVLATYSPGYDFRAVFTRGPAGTIFGRAYNSPQILVQNAPGVFGNAFVLNGGSLDAQASVAANENGSEIIAMSSGGLISRWTSGGAFIGNVRLVNFGALNNENNGIQNRGIVKAGGYYLTYSQGVLSAWDTNGNRIKTTILNGAGTSGDSYYGFSYCNKKVFIVDRAGGLWRGYDVGL